MRAKVIDISRWNLVGNYQEVKDAGIELVIMRATIGDFYTDIHFEQNWEGFGKVNMPRGIYHVVRPLTSAVLQFEYFKTVMGDRRPEVAPTLDIEVHEDQEPAIINAVCEEIVELFDDWYDDPDLLTWMYTRTNWWNKWVSGKGTLNVDWVGNHPLHIARYPWDLQPTQPEWPPETTDPGVLPDGFSIWDLWQWTEKGYVNGMDDPHHDKDVSRLPSSTFKNRFFKNNLEERVSIIEDKLALVGGILNI